MVLLKQFSFLDSIVAHGKQSHTSGHIYFFIKIFIEMEQLNSKIDKIRDDENTGEMRGSLAYFKDFR